MKKTLIVAILFSVILFGCTEASVERTKVDKKVKESAIQEEILSKNNQECADLAPEMIERLIQQINNKRVFFETEIVEVEEIFYSPKTTSCLYIAKFGPNYTDIVTRMIFAVSGEAITNPVSCNFSSSIMSFGDPEHYKECAEFYKKIEEDYKPSNFQKHS
jgi:hypothetical protein